MASKKKPTSSHEPPPPVNGGRRNPPRKPERPRPNAEIGTYLGNWDQHDPRTFLYADTGDRS